MNPPAAARHPSNGGELGAVLYFFICVLLICRSGAYAPCAYPRICSNCAAACFHILFIPSACACGYPRICSNCAAACFHILGFIAGEHRDRGDPVIIKSRISAGIIYWIAAPSAMARNDKGVWGSVVILSWLL